MNGPDHYQLAEQLLEHAAAMLNTDVALEGRAELVQRQAAVASMATGHALLAAAAAIGQVGHLDTADSRAWRKAAGTPLVP